MLAQPFRAILRVVLAVAAAAAWCLPAQAAVEVSFHSFNGSLLGRYPHAFVVFEGTLEGNGQVVKENYGFSAVSVGPAVLMGPVKHGVYTEKDKYIRTTNRHFTITVSDATYERLKQEVEAWRNAPGKYYDLETRNCIHFVGRLAELTGLRVEYPKEMLRKPKAWLNHVTLLNPQLGAKAIK